MSIKIAVYEDNRALRESLTYLVSGIEGFELCGAFPNCLSALENCRENKPNVILMDINMPGMSGIEATRLIKDHLPEVNILILTVFDDKERIFDALCAGATGYLLKKSSAQQIVEAIEDLHAGGSPMSSEIARKVLDFFHKEVPKENCYDLSERELEVLHCLALGDSYKMIGDRCCISMGTVRSHINNIYRKLQVNSKSEAVVKAMQERLV
ncbi:MAG: response regulator transcription factor [Bacteroidota bacterium]|nr:response regulator transcription factor [Bacteroidota bacterium]